MDKIKIITKEQQELNWKDLKIIGYNRLKDILANPKNLFIQKKGITPNAAMLLGIAGEKHYLKNILNTEYESDYLFATDEGVPVIQWEYKGYTFNAQPDCILPYTLKDKYAFIEIKTSKFDLDKLEKDYYNQLAFYAYVAELNGIKIEQYDLIKINPENFDDFKTSWVFEIDNLLKKGKEMVEQAMKIIDKSEMIELKVLQDNTKDLDVLRENFYSYYYKIKLMDESKKDLQEKLDKAEQEIKDYIKENGDFQGAYMSKKLVKKTKWKPQKRELESINYIEEEELIIKDWEL